MRRFLSLLTMLMLCGVLAFAQNRVVTGKVTDKDGNAVPFSTIKIKGTSAGTQADANGAFTVRVKDGTVLTISSAGYVTSDVNVGVRSTIVEVLELSNTSTRLTEVVVTALGVKKQAKELGYATAKINTDELNQAKVTNLSTGLAAKVSGLQIQLVNNGVKPDTRITLRGNRSILGNNQALLVVDDIQLPISYISTLNPNDVDNVTVLKGASASALYGSEASNGVIIVTTKRGVRGKPVVKLSSTASFETIAYMPEFQNEFGPWGGEGYNAPFMVHLSGSPYVPYAPYENQNYGPRFNGQKVPIGGPIRVYRNDGSFFIAQDSTLYAAKPNAKRDFFDKALTWTNDVSYSAGDEKSKFFFSFQDVNAAGVLPKDVSRRDAIRANGSKEAGIFRVDYNIGYSLTHTNTTPGTGVPFSSTTGVGGGYTGGGSYFQSRPLYWTIINQPALVDLRDYRNWQSNPYANPDGFYNAYYGNPWWQIDQTRLDERNNDLIAAFSLGVKPLSWLDINYKAGIARNDYSNKYTQQGYDFAPWAIADPWSAGNIPSGVKKLSPSQGDALSYSQRLTSDLLATVHTNYKSFDFKFILGTSLITNKQRIISTSANVLVIPNFFNISNRVGEPAVGENYAETRRVGAFGDLSIGYKNFLFLHGSLRNDWTSLLSEKNRSYLYPAADLSFVFTDAIKGLQNNNFLSFGKLRAAYSKTAQVSVGPYSLANTFNAGGGFPFGGVAGFSVNGRYANPNILPEISTDRELGIELAFWKNRILLSAAVYKTNTVNQTIPITISTSTGYSSSVVNSGEMQNKGIEVDLKFSPIVKTRSGFRWDVGGNVSYNENTVVSIGYGLSEVNVGGSSYAVVGKAYPVLKGTDWVRDPATNKIVVNKTSGLPTLNNTPQYFGTTNPPLKVGLNTSFSFKGFTVTAVADARIGAVIFNGIGSNLDFTGVSAYSASAGRQPFVIPNSVYEIAPNTGKYAPNTNINTSDGNIGFWANTWNSDFSNYVNSADFWKLREVSLSYTFPKKLMNGFVKGCSMQVSGRNLFTQKAKENVWSDPEFSNTTGNGTGSTDINQLPPTKFVAFSLNLTF